jgi:hypothetical protein
MLKTTCNLLARDGRPGSVKVTGTTCSPVCRLDSCRAPLKPGQARQAIPRQCDIKNSSSNQNFGNGQIQLTAIGTGGVTYDVLANADLTSTNWTKIGATQAAQNGGISFTDTNGASFSNRFYRLAVE